MREGLLIGVDGGGTHTRAVAVRQDGTVVAHASGKGINYNNIGIPAARANLRLVADELETRCAGAPCERLVVGLSALDGPADAETVRRFAGNAFDPARLDLESDAFTALMGATQGEPGVIVICGTGSMLLMLDEAGCQRVSGGWGHALGDVGSSYTLAAEGLRSAINAWEGTGSDTALCAAALAFFGVGRPRALIEKIYTPELEPGRVAQFARVVLSLAQTDEAAGEVVRDNMIRLARQTRALLRGHETVRRIGLYGGVFQYNPWVRELYAKEVRRSLPDAEIGLPAYPPEIGAVIHAFQIKGALTAGVLRRLSETACEVDGEQAKERMA